MEKDQKYENSNEKRSRKTAEKIVGKKTEKKGIVTTTRHKVQ